MNVLGDVVARERRSPAPALSVSACGRTYSYHDFCTSAYKAGNVLRYLGVDRGDVVAVEGSLPPTPVLACFGAAQLGAAVAFDASPDRVAAGEFRAAVVRHDRETEFDAPPGCSLAVHGGPPDDPAVTHWEQEVWSENPAFPPMPVEPADAALATDGRTLSHAAVLDAAGRAVDAAEIDAGATVAVRGPLTHPGVVAVGVVAPLVAGGTACFPDEGTVCDVAVGTGDAPEPVALSPDSLFE